MQPGARIGPLGPNHGTLTAKPSSHYVHFTLRVTLPTYPCPTLSADAEPAHKCTYGCHLVLVGRLRARVTTLPDTSINQILSCHFGYSGFSKTCNVRVNSVKPKVNKLIVNLDLKQFMDPTLL